MDYEWDEAKRTSNLAKHGVDFLSAEGFDWYAVLEFEDARRCYGERRWKALGVIGHQLYALVYTRRGGRVRIISLRIANRKEITRYETAFDLPKR